MNLKKIKKMHLFKKYNNHIIVAVIVIAAFAAVGINLLRSSHAASPYVSTEAEAGTLTSPATITDDSAASGGEAVQFGATPSTSLPLGLFQSSNNEQYSFPIVPKYAIQYYGWQEAFNTTNAQTAWNAGTESYVEMQTCGNPCDTTGISITDVISGTYDTYLTNFADAVKSFGHPVLLTFDHEMNGSWYPWGDTEITSTQWIQAWQHVTTLISSIAPNVTWVWAPNCEPGASSVASYWPGIGYSNPNVQMVGLDGYFSDTSATWANTFTSSYNDVKTASGGKYPFIVAETGVNTADSNVLTQISDMVSGAKSVNAAALMYYDDNGKNAWALTSAQETALINDSD